MVTTLKRVHAHHRGITLRRWFVQPTVQTV